MEWEGAPIQSRLLTFQFLWLIPFLSHRRYDTFVLLTEFILSSPVSANGQFFKLEKLLKYFFCFVLTSLEVIDHPQTCPYLAQLQVVLTEGSLKFQTPTAASSLMVSIDL